MEGPPAEPPVIGALEARPRLPPVRSTPHEPAIAPSLLVLFLAPLAALIVSGVAIVAAMAISTGGIPREGAEDRTLEWISEHAASPWLLLLAVLPGQLVFLAAAGLPALAGGSPARRLGLVPWNARTTTIALAVAGTLFVQQISGLVLDAWIDEPSESLKVIWRLVSAPQGAAAALALLLFSVVPGFCEELVFRGFVQTRLLRRWSPFAAIGLTSVVFAAAHADLQHSTGVLPLGLWLGFVAWRTGSVWTSVLCHFANNLVALALGRAFGDAETGSLPDTAAYWAFVIALLVLFVLSLVALLRPGGSHSSGRR